MALAFYFAPPNKMNAAQYNDCIVRLKAAGAHNPPGRLYHSCFGSADDLKVFDVWESQAAFEAFGGTLMPIMQAIGVTPGEPQVMGVHNTIVPPAPKAKAAAKNKPARKKSAAPKKKAKPAPRKKAKKR
jgi:hypothetical protein